MNNNGFSKSDPQSVLIVDDNPQNLQVLGKLLKENNYKIEFATNGNAALEWINKKSFDIILLDVNMPGMNGFETCTKIRSDHSFDNIPIIFLSADFERDSILKGFELGAQDYITKPYDSRELLSRVKNHLILKESLEKLANHNTILEATVAERTAQLREAVVQLEALNLKLLDLDKMKSEFLYLISHEIRTPLNGIIGPMELLKETKAAREVAELIEILDLSVKRLEKFSLNALLITRLKTNQSNIGNETVSVEKIIRTLLDENSEKIKNHSLSVSYDNNSTNSDITGESELIKICIGNILDNAISFSPDNGTVEIQLYDQDSYVVCRLKDNGPGFENKDDSDVFELFTMNKIRKDNSFGIGLPVCKLIMDAHSGKIEIGNNSEGGAFVALFFNYDPSQKIPLN